MPKKSSYMLPPDSKDRQPLNQGTSKKYGGGVGNAAVAVLGVVPGNEGLPCQTPKHPQNQGPLAESCSFRRASTVFGFGQIDILSISLNRLLANRKAAHPLTLTARPSTIPLPGYRITISPDFSPS